MRVRSRSVQRTQAAQAFAVGAILITGIVLTATFLYISINEPIEIKESEYQHAADVAADFSALCTSITALGESASTGASLSVPIRMGPAKESLITRIKESSGTISFSPTTEQVTVRVTENGTGSHAVWLDEDFTNTTNTTGVTVNTSSGYVTLAGPQPYAQGYVESNLSNNATGQIGKNTGSASTVYENLSWNTSLPGDTRIVLKVRTDMFPDMRHARNWSDCPAIESRDGFNTQNLRELSSVSPGHQYVQYRAELSTYDPSLTPTLLNVSISYYSPPEGVVLARSSGSISFTSTYFYLPDNELVYDNGAVIKSQQEGDFTLVNSGISAAKANNNTEIRISLFNLTGPSVPADLVYSGPSTTIISAYREDYELISDSFYYPNLTLNITTAYPRAWSSWLNKTLASSGLASGSDYDLLPPTNNSVQVVFHGQGAGVKLYLDKTTVQVRILRPR